MNKADTIIRLRNIIKRQAQIIDNYRVAISKIEEIVDEI